MIRAAAALMLYGLLISLSPSSPQVAADQEAQTPLFRSKTDAVMVDATVRDEKRRSITGLTADDFEVIDNGVPQRVHDLSYGKLPVDITIALDVSHSVSGGLLDRLRQAVVQLMGDLGKDDRLKLVLFNMKVTRTFDYTRDVRTVERAIRGATAGGGTSFYDAMSVTLVSESPPDRRQLAVFFTDGNDSTSTTSDDVLVEVARRTRATLAFVVPAATARVLNLTTVSGGVTFSTPIQQLQAPSPPLLRTLTRETGGTVFPVAATANLSTAFKTVLNEFRSAYVLYYSPRGVDRAGYHSIEVNVKRDGVQVQARRGYFSS